MTDLGIDGISDGVEIGRGGNAVVFNARQLDLDRDVAVKMLQIGHDEGARRRFDRERRLMAKLEHPNIAPVLESGYSAKGEPYLVMPLYDTALDQRDPMPWRECVDIMRRVGAAVAYAHDNGVLHRDLKPANIMLDGDRPVVLDFGIATLSDGAQSRSLALRLTPAFAPPEAFEIHEPSPSLDVYALGATTHALLRGRPPFTEPGDSGLWPVIRRVQSEPPTDLRDIAPSSVCEVIERAMAKSAGARQPTVSEFVQDLASAIAPETVLVESPRQSEPEPAPSWVERTRSRRRSILAVAVAALLAIALAVLVLRPWGRATTATEVDVAAVPSPTASPDPTATAIEPTRQPVERATALPTATPNALERIDAGVTDAMTYIGVDGQLPSQRPDCQGLFGWCIGDPVSDIEAALGDGRSWGLPSGNTFSVGVDDQGNIDAMRVTRAPGVVVALPQNLDLGTLTIGDVVRRFGANTGTGSGLDEDTFFYCHDSEQSIQIGYTILGAIGSRPPDATSVDEYRVFVDETNRRFATAEFGGALVTVCPDG